MVGIFWNRVKAWMSRNRPTLENVLIAAIGAAIFAGVATVVGVIGEVNLNDELSVWIAVSIAIVAAGVGSWAGLLAVRRYYMAQLRSSRLEREQITRQLSAIQPDYDALKRLGVYTDHFQNVLDSILAREITLVGFPKRKDRLVEKDRRIEVAFCRMPHEHILKTTGNDVRFSMWIEAKDRLRRGKFEIVFAPNHENGEVDLFSVQIKDTWLHQAAEHLRRHPESTRLHTIDDLDIAGLFGDDLEVFRGLGYRSVRAFSFELDGKPIRLVALSKTARVFSDVEDRYLLLLSRALAVGARDFALESGK